MQFEGKTVEEAVANGLSELKLTEKDVTVKVLEEPTKGLFGKLKGKAKVEITVNTKEDPVERTVDFVNGLIKIMNVNAKTELSGTDDEPVINLIAEKSSDVIGYRGEVLDAIQTLAGAVRNIGSKEYKKVVVDCENYRGKREETLIALAHRLEEKATEMRREVMLEPMNPFERRIIHTALSESTTVTTRSDGEEPNRYVVIVPNDKDEFSKPYNAGRNNNHSNDRKGKGGKRGGGKRDFKKGGFNKSGSGFSEIKKKEPSGFGTYLGNSKRDNI